MKNMWMWIVILALVGVMFFIGYSFATNQKKFKPSDGCEKVCTMELKDSSGVLKPCQNFKEVCPL